MEENNEEKNITITIKSSTHKALNIMKYNEGFETIDDVIKNLLEAKQ